MTRPGLPKMIATDLDGTLVRGDDTVSPYTHEVFARVRAAGIPVVGATGRGPRLLELSRRDLPSAEFMVMAGGGYVAELGESGRTHLDVRLEGPSVAALLDELEATIGPLTVMVEALDEPYAPLWGELDPSWPWPDRVEAVPRAEALDGEVIKVFVRADGVEIDSLLQVVRQVVPPTKATATQSGLGFVEICPAGIDKATGLTVVAELLGVDPDDVLVFGDMPNDLSMFAWAGWRRVAMANAHASLRAIADEITLANDEDGVAVWLDRLLGDRSVGD